MIIISFIMDVKNIIIIGWWKTDDDVFFARSCVYIQSHDRICFKRNLEAFCINRYTDMESCRFELHPNC